MQYIIFTYIDSLTGIGINKTPATNTKIFPNISGLVVTGPVYPQTKKFLEFFGSCDDGVGLNAEGVIKQITKAEYNNLEFDYLDSVYNIPLTITVKQLRLVLLKLKLLDKASAIIPTLPQTMQIEWEYSDSINRKSSLILELMDRLLLTPKQINRIYLEGNTL